MNTFMINLTEVCVCVRTICFLLVSYVLDLGVQVQMHSLNYTLQYEISWSIKTRKLKRTFRTTNY